MSGATNKGPMFRGKRFVSCKINLEFRKKDGFVTYTLLPVATQHTQHTKLSQKDRQKHSTGERRCDHLQGYSDGQSTWPMLSPLVQYSGPTPFTICKPAKPMPAAVDIDTGYPTAIEPKMGLILQVPNLICSRYSTCNFLDSNYD